MPAEHELKRYRDIMHRSFSKAFNPLDEEAKDILNVATNNRGFEQALKKAPVHWHIGEHRQDIMDYSTIELIQLDKLLEEFPEEDNKTIRKHISDIGNFSEIISRDRFLEARKIAVRMSKMDEDDRERYLATVLSEHEDPIRLVMALHLLEKPEGYKVP